MPVGLSFFSIFLFGFFDVNDPANRVGDQRDHVNDQKGNEQRRGLLHKRGSRPENRTQRGDQANDPKKRSGFLLHTNLL